jgi:AcrR family transcriptional regulator
MKLDKNIILNEVNTLVHISGFNSATIATIAKNLSTTRENIHHHFKTKDNLGILYIDFLYKFLEDYFYEINNSNLSFDKKIDKYFEIYNIHSKEYASCPILSLLADYKLLNTTMQDKLKSLFKLEINSLKFIINTKHNYNEKKLDDISHHIIILLKGASLYEKASYKQFDKSVKYIKDTIFIN